MKKLESTHRNESRRERKHLLMHDLIDLRHKQSHLCIAFTSSTDHLEASQLQFTKQLHGRSKQSRALTDVPDTRFDHPYLPPL